MRIAPLVSVLALTACSSPPPAMPAGQGKGLIAFDPEPPAGARTWPCPQWHKGDRFTWLRGGQERMAFSVAEVGEHVYVLADPAGNQLVRGRDLSNVGEHFERSDRGEHELAPPDVRYHWPLWVGKRWRCHYLDKTAGGPSLPIEAQYVVEDIDTVAVPGGTFEALRIVRTSRLVLDGPDTFFDRDSVIWYAPSIGIEVRQMVDETRVELLEWQPASSSAPAPGAKASGSGA